MLLVPLLTLYAPNRAAQAIEMPGSSAPAGGGANQRDLNASISGSAAWSAGRLSRVRFRRLLGDRAFFQQYVRSRPRSQHDGDVCDWSGRRHHRICCGIGPWWREAENPDLTADRRCRIRDDLIWYTSWRCTAVCKASGCRTRPQSAVGPSTRPDQPLARSLSRTSVRERILTQACKTSLPEVTDP